MQLAYYGAFAAAHFVAAAFFLRFWTRTRAPLLLIFAVSFVLLGVSYGLLCLTNLGESEPSAVYLVRLASFVLIIVGIVWANIRHPAR